MKQAQVYFLNVGWGDAHVIRHPSGSITIIDGGDAGPLADEDTPVNWMARNGYDVLDWMILTHLHEDHMDGFIEAAQSVKIKKAVMPYRPMPWPGVDLAPIADHEQAVRSYGVVRKYMRLISLLTDKNVPIVWRDELTQSGHVVWEQQGYTLKHLYPSAADPLPAYDILLSLSARITALSVVDESIADDLASFFDQSNHDSSVYALSHTDNGGAHGVLFGGDLMNEEWEQLRTRTNIQAQVWKASHHGLDDACALETLKAINPQHVVIPVDTLRSARQREIWQQLQLHVQANVHWTGAYLLGTEHRLDIEGSIEIIIGSK